MRTNRTVQVPDPRTLRIHAEDLFAFVAEDVADDENFGPQGVGGEEGQEFHPEAEALLGAAAEVPRDARELRNGRVVVPEQVDVLPCLRLRAALVAAALQLVPGAGPAGAGEAADSALSRPIILPRYPC